MSDSMRILTYNTQMRSALMEMGFPPSIPPVYTAPTRAKLIARAIRRNPEQIDVVCLNEIFDEPSRAVLSNELAPEFRFQVTKADTFHTRIRSPGLTDDVMERIWELTFGPVEDLAGIALLKFEDSGLFLASRFPFATVPTPPEVFDLLGGPGTFPLQIPVVRFLMYADSSDNDKFAAKGVLYARLKPPGAGFRHVFLSHTQADTEAVGENTGDRRKQMQNVADFIEHCIGETPPFTQEVFFCGDLNIVGHGDETDDAHPADPDATPEWTRLFGEPGGPLFEQMVDRWGRDQCPGGSTGRTDPGFTADVVYPPVRQRLDYLFTSASSRLAVQHLRVARDLADPKGAMPFLSDHQPLLADIHAVSSHCTPRTAFSVPDVVDFSDSRGLFDGNVVWYRFDTPGTYDIRLTFNGGRTDFDIYLGDDFSTPQPPYREIVDPELGARFVLVAPFFLKVFLKDRRSESGYDLHTHRHTGRSFHDAIVLAPGQRIDEHFPAQPFNNDTGDADWDDSESKWFLVQTPRVAVSQPIPLTVTVRDQTHDVLLTVGRWDGQNPPATFLDQAGASADPLPLSWEADDNEHFVVLVQRQTGTSTPVAFAIELETPLSLLLARPSIDTTLTCQKETSGWGADDIAVQVWADGVKIGDIPNSVIGDFEDDHVRTVGDKLPAITPYLDGVEVLVIEEDAIDPDDVGRGTIPRVDRVAGAPGFTVLHTGLDGRVQASLTIGVDDGRYAFACVISRWHPSA
ncbi:hypothetical protein LRS13_19980 [Svornostia abyssi]|uniref:Endonuclease/exonuclease/phosphatase domain-containing protein n=1 Tax=Svornostia abyssi TaxID=2898438 RepID=A0ABY5PE48_9ACTN|nr:hypothetical protein LRS13_19980 [Parviterribacteraceae bacterium J379]